MNITSLNCMSFLLYFRRAMKRIWKVKQQHLHGARGVGGVAARCDITKGQYLDAN